MTVPPLRVLLVEDEALNRALVQAILRRSSEAAEVELVEADTIRGARETLEREPIDVVLLDVRLPDGSGLELAREISETRGESTPFVAILSASVLIEEREAAELSGADAFLGKPFAPRELVSLLERFAARAAERRAGRPLTDSPTADASTLEGRPAER